MSDAESTAEPEAGGDAEAEGGAKPEEDPNRDALPQASEGSVSASARTTALASESGTIRTEVDSTVQSKVTVLTEKESDHNTEEIHEEEHVKLDGGDDEAKGSRGEGGGEDVTDKDATEGAEGGTDGLEVEGEAVAVDGEAVAVDGEVEGAVVDGEVEGAVVDGEVEGDVVDGEVEGAVADGEVEGAVVDGGGEEHEKGVETQGEEGEAVEVEKGDVEGGAGEAVEGEKGGEDEEGEKGVEKDEAGVGAEGEEGEKEDGAKEVAEVKEEAGEEGEKIEPKEGEEAKEGETVEGQEATPETAAEVEEGVQDAQQIVDDSMGVIKEEDDEVSQLDGPEQPQQIKLRQKAASGDFNLDRSLDENELEFGFSLPSLDISSSYHEGYVVEDNVSIVDTTESAQTTLAERERYFENYQAQIALRTTLLRRNKILQKKLMDHYKKRKIDVFRDTNEEVTVDMESKYLKRLTLFAEAQAEDERERSKVKAQIAAMEDDEQQLSETLDSLVDNLVDFERETTVGLIDTKTGKVINERLVERLLKRQRQCVYDLGETRLNYIRLRDKVTSKEDAIRDMEDLGENLSMMDYEQLRMENQNLIDKIEERDEELARLRSRAVNSIQALAHWKEKECAVLTALDVEADLLKQKESQLEHTRSELNELKITRDRLRADYLRATNESGLLTKPQLLRDFEKTVDDRDVLREQLAQVQATCTLEKRHLVMIREAIEKNAVVEVEVKKKPKWTYMDLVNSRIEDQRAKRAAARQRTSLTKQEDSGVFQL